MSEAQRATHRAAAEVEGQRAAGQLAARAKGDPACRAVAVAELGVFGWRPGAWHGTGHGTGRLGGPLPQSSSDLQTETTGGWLRPRVKKNEFLGGQTLHVVGCGRWSMLVLGLQI